jgi:hypothetical protein
MEQLQYSLIASLIPSAALLGVLFAFQRRRQLLTLREAGRWLGLAAGTFGLAFAPVLWRTFNETLSFVGICAFAFVFPHCAFCWVRLQRADAPGNVSLFRLMALVLSFLALLGIFWFCLNFGLSLTIAAKVWGAFR